MKKEPSYRELFADMPPLTNDRDDPAKSDVIAHIRKTLACDVERAMSVFHILRAPRRRIIAHNKITGLWSGVNLVTVEDEFRKVWGIVKKQGLRIAELNLQNQDILAILKERFGKK